ncbi:unnamed protein product, partial [Allacma fusca]
FNASIFSSHHSFTESEESANSSRERRISISSDKISLCSTIRRSSSESDISTVSINELKVSYHRSPSKVSPKKSPVKVDKMDPSNMTVDDIKKLMADHEKATREMMDWKKRAREAEEFNGTRFEDADATGGNQNVTQNTTFVGISPAQMNAIMTKQSESMAKMFEKYGPKSRPNFDNSPQESCIEIPQRHFNLNAAADEFEYHIPGSLSLIKIDPVVFRTNGDGSEGKGFNLQQILDNTRLKSWEGAEDHRVAEEFVVEFEKEMRPYVKNNKNYNILFSNKLEGVELVNFQNQMDLDAPWHENARKFIKEFSNNNVYTSDNTCLFKDKKNPNQSVTDFVTFWLKRMRWNPCAPSIWVAEMIVEKIKPFGYEFREVFKESKPEDSIENLIARITKMEQAGSRDIERRDISASSYYHQHMKSLIDKSSKKKNKSDNKSFSSSGSSGYQKPKINSNNSNNSNNNRTAQQNLLLKKFKPGQLFKKTINPKDPNSADMKKIASIEEVNLTENVEIYMLTDKEGNTDGRSIPSTDRKPTAKIISKKGDPIKKPTVPETPPVIKEKLYIMGGRIAYIGNRAALQFMKYVCFDTSKDEYILCQDSLTVPQINKILEEKTFDIPSTVDTALLSVGLQESVWTKKFDSSAFHHHLKKLVINLRDKHHFKKIIFMLTVPLRGREEDLEYWKTLQEVNSKLFYIGHKEEGCRFWNIFSFFVQRNELWPNEKK